MRRGTGISGFTERHKCQLGIERGLTVSELWINIVGFISEEMTKLFTDLIKKEMVMVILSLLLCCMEYLNSVPTFLNYVRFTTLLIDREFFWRYL